MNPGFLVPDLEITSWYQFKPQERAFEYRVVCGCAMKPVHMAPSPMVAGVRPVTVQLYRFRNHSEEAEIYIGRCENCKQGVWGAFEFHWLLWMTPEQQIKCVLDSAQGLRYVRREHEQHTSQIVLLDSRRHLPPMAAHMIFRRGKLLRIVYARTENDES